MLKKIKPIIQRFSRYIRFRLSVNNSPLFIGFYKYFYSPQKGSLSEFLNEYSLSKGSSFHVIQIGANDGIFNDPIHKFIKRDGWKGVLLEPQKHVFQTYLSKIYQKNKGIYPIHAAIAAEDGTQKLYKIGFSNMRWATGLASFKKENLERAFSSGYVEKQCLKHNIPLPSPEEYITSEEIKTISPDTLLREYNISHIDLLHIDTEGFDFEVIRLFDIQNTQPKAIVFEHIHLSEDDKASCLSHLHQNQYQIKRFGANTLAMKHPLGKYDKFF